MLAYVLAIAVGLGSFALYLAAFFFPEIHRKNDFIWSGVGLFYALVLWICAGRITGGVLLGQMASVSLLGWLGWQTLILRLAIARSGETEFSPEISEKLNKFNPFKAKKVQKPPVIQDQNPKVKETTPQDVTSTPDLIEETPVIEETPPVSLQETPVIEETPPVSLQETPVIEETPPVSLQETPVIEETPPESLEAIPETPEVDQPQEIIPSEREISPTPEVKPVTAKTTIKDKKKSGFSLGSLFSGLFSKKEPKTTTKPAKIEKIEKQDVLEDDWGDDEVTKTETVESFPITTDEGVKTEAIESSPVAEEVAETENQESSPVSEEVTETVESAPVTDEILEENPILEEIEEIETETPIEEKADLETPIETENSSNLETIEPETVIPEVESIPVEEISETKPEETIIEENNSNEVILEAKIVSSEAENSEKSEDLPK